MADIFGGEEFLNNLKNYCKVDQDFDDKIIIEMANAASTMIAKAIDKSKTPDDYADEPRFKIAVMKQVKEDYYERGLTADSYRPEIGSGINGIINQLRSEVTADETQEHDWTNYLLLRSIGRWSGDATTTW